jgi:uncharacterized protein
VKVKVLGVDLKAKRIALSIKALTAPAARPVGKPAQKPVQKPVAKPEASMNEKLAALSTKWKVR